MLPRLQAERQLMAIEAATVPHMKPEDARRVHGRHARLLRTSEEKKPVSAHLLDAFQQAGFAIVEEPAAKK